MENNKEYYDKLYELQMLKEKNIITEEELKREKDKLKIEEKKQEERKENKIAIIKATIFFGLFALLLVLSYIMTK